eukprot:Gregarina_sp_Poly_1__5418@NODE_2863_length_1616_cov_1771_515817_g1807_i0_p1_GENE_NODE_2863_length_1616_cov_1771_515817_g1807_i0NODE_2863_length_1616_cov_1771_515817_g1807_i0_p1_ORF_typecomplete_len421_score53_55DUF4432/PF14486_6/9_5e61_NODE_2863_length_1616_cov_1771_515817_g1807_i02691531
MQIGFVFLVYAVAAQTQVPIYNAAGLNEGDFTFGAAPTATTVSLKSLHGGKQEGVAYLSVMTPSMTVNLVPTRGMNVRNVTSPDGRTLLAGWSSGVTEIVNPMYLNQMDRAGSGFLDGFNEMVVRCGYEYVGHAGEDGAEGMLTLHGKAANTPISNGTIIYDDATNEVRVEGIMFQRAFKKAYFTIHTSISISTTGKAFTISDRLVNEGAYPAEYMSLYHSNYGPPILAADSTLHIAALEVSPFNARAVQEIDSWDAIQGPTEGYDETVFNIFPKGDANNKTAVALIKGNKEAGIQMEWDVGVMPALSLWKNLELEGMGYVVGLEPGTSFSYNRVFQRPLGLVPTLAAGDSVTFEIVYTLLDSPSAADQAIQRIADLGANPEISREPLSDEGASAATDAAISSLLSSLSLVVLLITPGLL